MFNRKAVSTYVPGYMLVDAAMYTILIQDSYEVPVPTVQNSQIRMTNKGMKMQLLKKGDILNIDIVEIPANYSLNDDIVQTDLTMARTFRRINIMSPQCFRPDLLKYYRTLKKKK